MARLKHKRGRKSNYVKYLDNPNHKEVRERCLLRDNFTCRFDGCSAKIRLETHHISYHVLGKELEDGNLIWCVTLCEKHHDIVHKDVNHIWNPKNKQKKAIL